MASFRAAIEHGAEMIEADAQLSRDGELALMHDDTIDRTTDGHGLVGDLTWDELSHLDAGGWFDPAFSGLRIPRVVDLLDLARDTGIGLCLEAKGPTPDHKRRVAVALAALIAEHDAVGRAFVSSFDHEALAAAKATVPDLMLAPERLPEHGPQAADETVRQALALGAPVIQHRWELITADLAAVLHDAGIAIWAWNTNDDDSTRSSIALGVDGVIGDDIDVLVAGRDAVDAASREAAPG